MNNSHGDQEKWKGKKGLGASSEVDLPEATTYQLYFQNYQL